MEVQKEYWNEFIIDWDKSVYNKDTEKMGFIEKLATKFRGILVFRMNFALDSLKKYIPNKKVIEIGCGTGRFSLELLKMGAESVYGTDISDLAIDEANKMYAEANISKDKFKFESIDLKDFQYNEQVKGSLVTGLGILQYLSKDELKNLFAKLNGADLFFEFHEDKFSLIEVCHTIYRSLKTNLPYYHKLTKAELREIFSKADYPDLYYMRIRNVAYFTSLPIDGWEKF
jgi:2-polyprenyl-3-methyl-5-hydroxy-6-metoxy-1,4-benzoquinol methylase